MKRKKTEQQPESAPYNPNRKRGQLIDEEGELTIAAAQARAAEAQETLFAQYERESQPLLLEAIDYIDRVLLKLERRQQLTDDELDALERWYKILKNAQNMIAYLQQLETDRLNVTQAQRSTIDFNSEHERLGGFFLAAIATGTTFIAWKMIGAGGDWLPGLTAACTVLATLNSVRRHQKMGWNIVFREKLDERYNQAYSQKSVTSSRYETAAEAFGKDALIITVKTGMTIHNDEEATQALAEIVSTAVSEHNGNMEKFLAVLENKLLALTGKLPKQIIPPPSRFISPRQRKNR